MRNKVGMGVALALIAAVASVDAAETAGGLAPGDSVGTFSATKCAGIDDGIDPGKRLCYT